ncbi:MAG TPA: hypothetical protein VL326_01245 [Kofleriaceae bacterium]|nr:hypothetical protein [Kofleriaceae bacterium]
MRWGASALLVAACGRIDFDPLGGDCPLWRLTDAPYANSSEGADGIDAPFLICTPRQLDAIGSRPEDWNKAYVIGRDLEMSELTTPFTIIGSPANRFTGTLDGGAHAIGHFVLDRPQDDYVGLFGSLGRGAQISNLKLATVSITGRDYVGALAGYSEDTLSVQSVTVDGVITGDKEVGGVLGYSNCLTECQPYELRDVIVDVDLTATAGTGGGVLGGIYSNQFPAMPQIVDVHASGQARGAGGIGGIIGDAEYVEIRQASSSVTVTAGIGAGGVMGGSVYIATKIIDSVATGSVTCTGSAPVGGSTCGGLVGDMEGAVFRSYATGRVDCPGDYCGGLAGSLHGATESYATGAVSGRDHVGGLAGDAYGTDTVDCYARGDVTGRDQVGGLLGSVSDIMVLRNYATGRVIGNDNVGGLVGAVGGSGAPRLEGNFATSSVSGTSASDHVSLTFGQVTIGNILNNSYTTEATCTNTAGSCSVFGQGVPAASDFYSAATPPLTSWDFSGVWQENAGALPTLRNTPP